MEKLIVTCVRGGRAGERVELTGDAAVFGRRPECDVSFDVQRDTKASGRHAEVRRDGARWVLADLGSTNGTWLGEDRVEGEVELADGANVEFGRGGPVYNVRIVREEPPAADGPGPGDVQELLPPPPAPEQPEHSGRTAIYQAMMQETVRRSSLGLKIALGVLGVLLAGGAVAAWLIIRAQQEDAEAQRRKTEALEAETTGLKGELSRTRQDLSAAEGDLAAARQNLAATTGKLADLRQQIEKTEGEARTKLEAQAQQLERARADYEAKIKKQEEDLAAVKKTGQAAELIASQYERSLFMLIAAGQGGLSGFCTAFAVTEDGLLATNAHCVRAIADFDGRGVGTVARMNRDPSRTYRVLEWRAHPAYRGIAFSTDVALVRVDLKGDRLPAVPPLASDETVRRLAPGQAVYTMGFPGRVMNESLPTADFRAAVVSRLTTFENRAGAPNEARMVWHSALTSKGTSGSPIFNAAGEVVAVNNGGLSARATTVMDPQTGQPHQDVTYDATGLNFGIRVDALREILP